MPRKHISSTIGATITASPIKYIFSHNGVVGEINMVAISCWLIGILSAVSTMADNMPIMIIIGIAPI